MTSPTSVSSSQLQIPYNYEVVENKELRAIGIKNTKIWDRIKLFFTVRKKADRDGIYITKGKNIYDKANIQFLKSANPNISKIFNENFNPLPCSGLKLKPGSEINEAERLLLLSHLKEDTAFMNFVSKETNLNLLTLEKLKELKKEFDDTNRNQIVENAEPAFTTVWWDKVLTENKSVMEELKDHLPQLHQLIEYGMEFTKDPGYPHDIIVATMSSLISKFGDLQYAVEEGKIYGWNITDNFKEVFPHEVFKIYVKSTSQLDFAETELLMNYYRDIKMPVTKGDLEWAKAVGLFIRAKMKEGYAFTDINSLLQKNLIFKPGSKIQVTNALPASLEALGKGLHKPKIDSHKIAQAIHDHPIKVLGAVLDSFITALLPDKDKMKAGTIRDGFEKLDTYSKDIKVVRQIQEKLNENSSLIQILLPVLLADSDKAVQDLILLASRTIDANLKTPPETGELKQLTDLVSTLMDNAKAMRFDPQSIFFGLPTTVEEQQDLRSGLKKIKFFSFFYSLLGNKIIAKSHDFQKQVPAELREEVSQLVAPMTATFAAALPTIVKKFSVEKYLDFLLKVGDFNARKITESELNKEIWQILKIFVTDISQFSGSIPEALDAIRKLGIE